MSLSELLDETVPDHDSDNNNSELTGLAKMVSMKEQYDKFNDPNRCPKCGSTKTEKVHYYWRCNNGNCKTLTFLSSHFKLDKSKFW